jgi:hypothetical protein
MAINQQCKESVYNVQRPLDIQQSIQDVPELGEGQLVLNRNAGFP